MAEFYYYGTLKLAIELKSVLTVVFVQGWFPRSVARISRFFGFDSTYQSAEENLANLHYRIVKLDGPSVYATSFKRSEISCHLANNREILFVRSFSTATQIIAKIGFVNYIMSRQSQRIHRGMIVVILASYLLLATSISCAIALA